MAAGNHLPQIEVTSRAEARTLAAMAFCRSGLRPDPFGSEARPVILAGSAAPIPSSHPVPRPRTGFGPPAARLRSPAAIISGPTPFTSSRTTASVGSKRACRRGSARESHRARRPGKSAGNTAPRSARARRRPAPQGGERASAPAGAGASRAGRPDERIGEHRARRAFLVVSRQIRHVDDLKPQPARRRELLQPRGSARVGAVKPGRRESVRRRQLGDVDEGHREPAERARPVGRRLAGQGVGPGLVAALVVAVDVEAGRRPPGQGERGARAGPARPRPARAVAVSSPTRSGTAGPCRGRRARPARDSAACASRRPSGCAGGGRAGRPAAAPRAS